MSRLQKGRQTHQRHRVARALQSGVILSFIFIGFSQQTGPTYGEFSTGQEANDSISICKVFPDDIQHLLDQLSSAVGQASELQRTIQSASIPTFDTSLQMLSTAGMTLEGLQATANLILEQQAALSAKLSQLNQQTELVQVAQKELEQRMTEGALLLQQLYDLASHNDTNCLEIREGDYLDRISSSLRDSSAFSEMNRASLDSLLQYLRTIHLYSDQLSHRSENTEDLPPVLPNLLPASSSDFINRRISTYYQNYMNQYSTAKAAIESGISQLGSQLAEVQTAIEAERARLEAEEKAKKEALEKAKQLELERAKQAEAEKEKPKGDQAKDPVKLEPAPLPVDKSPETDPKEGTSPNPSEPSVVNPPDSDAPPVTKPQPEGEPDVKNQPVIAIEDPLVVPPEHKDKSKEDATHANSQTH